MVGYWDSNNGCMVARAPWQLRGEVLDAKVSRVSPGGGVGLGVRGYRERRPEACCGLLRRAVQPQRAKLKILVMRSLSFHGLQAFAGIH